MSPASSASPVAGKSGGSLHPPGQPNSSLQQLEQMVLPGAKDGQMQQQPKTPKSPSGANVKKTFLYGFL
jgi:hypothetical protein